jgi:integrase
MTLQQSAGYIPPAKVIPPYDLWRTGRAKPENRWRGAYQDGIRPSPHTKVFKRKADAQEWAALQLAAIRDGNHVTAKAAKKTLESWCAEWLDLQTAGANSKTSYRWALNVIMAYFGPARAVSSIKEQHVKAFLISLEGNYRFGSRVYLNKILGRLLGEAHRNGLTPKCPWVDPRVAADPDFDYDDGEHTEDSDHRFYPSTEQVWQLYDQIAPEYRSAVLLGAFVGLRIAEVAGARVEDIEYEDRDGHRVAVMHPKRQWIRPLARPSDDKVYGPLKTKASRKPVPIPTPIADELAALLGGRSAGQIVLRPDGRAVQPHDIATALVTAVNEIGGELAALRFHGLRHYLASTAIAEGEDIMTVCDRMRHKNPGVTLNTYTHLVKAAERRATDAIGAEAMRGRRAATAARWEARRISGAEIS